MSPGVDGSRSIGVPSGSARSRSDEIGTVGTGGAAATRVSAVDGVGCRGGTQDGVLTRRAEGRGAQPGPKP